MQSSTGRCETTLTRPCIARAAAICSIAASGGRLRPLLARFFDTIPHENATFAGADMTVSAPSAMEPTIADAQTSLKPSVEPSLARNRLVLVVYTAAIFVSALLLFSVQPLFTKMVLPRLGGSPAVWSVAMVFFRSLLLAGYAYAHYLTKLRNRAAPVVIHLALLAVAMLTLPLAIRSG